MVRSAPDCSCSSCSGARRGRCCAWRGTGEGGGSPAAAPAAPPQHTHTDTGSAAPHRTRRPLRWAVSPGLAPPPHRNIQTQPHSGPHSRRGSWRAAWPGNAPGIGLDGCGSSQPRPRRVGSGLGLGPVPGPGPPGWGFGAGLGLGSGSRSRPRFPVQDRRRPRAAGLKTTLGSDWLRRARVTPRSDRWGGATAGNGWGNGRGFIHWPRPYRDAPRRGNGQKDGQKDGQEDSAPPASPTPGKPPHTAPQTCPSPAPREGAQPRAPAPVVPLCPPRVKAAPQQCPRLSGLLLPRGEVQS